MKERKATCQSYGQRRLRESTEERWQANMPDVITRERLKRAAQGHHPRCISDLFTDVCNC